MISVDDGSYLSSTELMNKWSTRCHDMLSAPEVTAEILDETAGTWGVVDVEHPYDDFSEDLEKLVWSFNVYLT